MNYERLKDLSPDDRKTLLEGDAIEVTEGKYVKQLTSEELAFYKDKLADRSIQQATILDELQIIKDDFKARLDPVKADIRMALQAVKFKAIEAVGRQYKLADHDEKMIYYADELGQIISSRRMLPEERQYRMSLLKEQKSA